MGSKGVLLSGIALIIGVYAVGIKKADVVIAGAAGTHAYEIQSENDARMGVRAGIHSLKDDVDGGGGGIYYTDSFIFMGDTVRYTFDILPSSTTGKITSISNFKGWKTTLRASIQRKFSYGSNENYWEITKSYIVPNPDEANYLYQ